YTIMQYFILCPHYTQLILLSSFAGLTVSSKVHVTLGVTCILTSILIDIYFARPLASFDFFFPLTRCAFSFFLCLEFIHIGYCPCWSSLIYLETETED
uniref:Uncharacterized protein n=1 Tax=Otus sunia TaxID=257818 RepID=A0A8C8E9Q8_9STRI